jgi:hypothetical protein
MHNERPSATALLIAKSQLLLPTEAVSAARAVYYRAFVEAVEREPWYPNLASRYWHQFLERVSIPGIYLHYALRKLWVEIKRFFKEVRSCTRNGNSHLLFTYMNKQASGSIQFESATKLVDYWLWLKNEVFRWGIATSELAGFLSAKGYRLVRMYDADYLAKQHLPDKNITVARGENICLARVEC